MRKDIRARTQDSTVQRLRGSRTQDATAEAQGLKDPGFYCADYRKQDILYLVYVVVTIWRIRIHPVSELLLDSSWSRSFLSQTC